MVRAIQLTGTNDRRLDHTRLCNFKSFFQDTFLRGFFNNSLLPLEISFLCSPEGIRLSTIPVVIAVRPHLFPFRTQKLNYISPFANKRGGTFLLPVFKYFAAVKKPIKKCNITIYIKSIIGKIQMYLLNFLVLM